MLQNTRQHSDVNNDYIVAPNDALLIINYLNRQEGAVGESPSDVQGDSGIQSYYDTNGDGYGSPLDALKVLNSLNAEGQGNPVMEYIFRTYDASGTNQITTVGVGQQFQVKVFVHDLRNLPPVGGKEQGGVFAAYTDMLYNSNLVTVSGTIQHDTTFYGNSQLGSTATPGVVDGAGSFASALTPPGNAEKLLWTLNFTAGNTPGTVTFDGQPTTDAADPGDAGQSPSRDTGIYTQDKPVCPSQAQGGCSGDMEHVDATLQIVQDLVANNDSFTINEGAPPQTFDVRANDQIFNPPGGTITISSVTQGSNGGTVVNNNTSVTYTVPNTNFNGVETFTYTISNGQGATSTATVTVNVTAVNDAPTVSVPGAQSTNEDVALVFSTATGRAITAADVDGDIAATVTIAATNGTLSLPASAGVTITGNNTSSLQLTGTISAINAGVNGNGLTFTPTANFSGNGSLVYTINDNGNTGTGGPLTGSGTVAITIGAVNDPPVNATPGNVSTDEDVPLTLSTANGNALSVSDSDAGNSPITLALSVNSGGTLNLASTTNLTVTGNGTTAINITGTIANINAALGNGLTFTPTAGFIGTVGFTMVSNDQGATGSGGAQSDTDTFNIDVVPTVRPKALNDTAQVNEDTAAGVTINVLANDRANTGAQLLLLSFTQPTTGTVTRVDNGTASTSDDQLNYTAPANFAGTATFTYTVNDTSGQGADSTATVVVTVNAVNDPPSVTVPGGQNVNEDATLTINGISVADIDAGTGNVEVTLAVNSGVVTVGTGGVTVTNNGTANVKITGTVANVNTVLNGGVQYTGNLNFNGSDSLTVTISDLGNTGTPGPLTDTENVAITVAAINDAPVNTLPAANKIQAIKNLDTVLSAANGNAISIADVDAGNANVSVTISVAHGRLTLGNTANLTVVGNGTASVVITGSVTNINAALAAGVTYSPTTDYEGSETLTVVTNDLGNTGSPGPLSDTDSVTFQVQSFVPSSISGKVFVDTDADGAFDPEESGLEGVLITLSGTDFFNVPVNVTTRTLRDGSYSFDLVKPGTYDLTEEQPAGMMDGRETFSAPITANGNDKGSVTIGIQGGLTSVDNLFAELGVQAQFARAFDLLASSGDPANSSGVILGLNANSGWAILRGTAWANYENARVTVTRTYLQNGYRHAEVQLTVFNTVLGRDQTVTINSGTNARLIFIDDNGTRVLRFRGRPEDLPLASVGGGEGESHVDADPAREFADGVDQVMSQMA